LHNLIVFGIFTRAFLCLMKFFSSYSISSSDPLPQFANWKRISDVSWIEKYLNNPSLINFDSIVSQSSLSYNYI
jgi:hypothetical protein